MTIIDLIDNPIVQQIVANAAELIKENTGFEVALEIRSPKKLEENSIDDIIKKFCAVWAVTPNYVTTKKRKRERVIMRQILSLRLRMSGFYLQQIGDILGGYDHTSVIHAMQTAEDRIKSEDELFLQYFLPVQHLFGIHFKKPAA